MLRTSDIGKQKFLRAEHCRYGTRDFAMMFGEGAIEDFDGESGSELRVPRGTAPGEASYEKKEATISCDHLQSSWPHLFF
jgi:hypothetical protein